MNTKLFSVITISMGLFISTITFAKNPCPYSGAPTYCTVAGNVIGGRGNCNIKIENPTNIGYRYLKPCCQCLFNFWIKDTSKNASFNFVLTTSDKIYTCIAKVSLNPGDSKFTAKNFTIIKGGDNCSVHKRAPDPSYSVTLQ